MDLELTAVHLVYSQIPTCTHVKLNKAYWTWNESSATTLFKIHISEDIQYKQRHKIHIHAVVMIKHLSAINQFST